MLKLESSLKEWVARGLISQDQAQSIRDHETAKPEGSWILSGLLILGVVIVGIGIISIVAANWEQIPDGVKLSADLLFLVGLAFAALRSWDAKKEIRFEALLLAFLILCLASIGLISQVYHTSGKLYEALLVWSLITIAVPFIARHVFVPFLWGGAFLAGVVFSAVDSATLGPVFQSNYQAVFMAAPLLCACITIVTRSLAGEIPVARAFRAWTLLGGLAALVVAELPELSKKDAFETPFVYFPGYLLAVFAAFALWQTHEYKRTQKILLIVTLGLFLVPFHLPLLGAGYMFLFAALTIAVLASMAVFLASQHERWLFQIFLSFIGLRFLVLYFQAFGGLATTGLGLILSGGVIIGLAVLWNRYRVALAVKAEEWTR